MLRTYTKIATLLIITLLPIACELEHDRPIEASAPVIIVDAIITNENIKQTIKIYYSNTELNSPNTPVSGANVTFATPEERFYFNETEPGIYTSQPLQVAINNNYTLHIEIDGQADSATAEMAPITALSDYLYVENDSGYFRLYDRGSATPAMTEVLYDWSDNESYCKQYGACYAAQIFYSLNNFNIEEEFAPKKEQIIVPPNTKVYRKKYSLSNAHQNFIRSLLIETEWRGGFFDAEHGNIPTNFSSDFQGWFAVCQVLSDSTIIVKQ